MVFRCILPKWMNSSPLPKVREGEFTDEQIKALNSSNYNVYFLPNYPSAYQEGKPVDGGDIDVFRFVFVDFDLKSGNYANKQAFISYVQQFPDMLPTFTVNSGNGVHVYWQVDDLDAISYLKLQRRLCRLFKTDEAVSKIYQLMRVPGTINTKHEGAFVKCDYVQQSDATYTCEQLDRHLPPLTAADETYCKQHYDKTYGLADTITVNDAIPAKFAKLMRDSQEVKALWKGNWEGSLDDRSKADYKLGHLLFADGFSKDEAMSVLINVPKAVDRAPQHRISYAQSIVDKIWTFENEEESKELTLSKSVKEILQAPADTLKGVRFPCNPWIDATEHGFRLGQVIGLVAGSGVGKTAMALNMFKWFVERNPNYDHMFIPLEQPVNEIADRWKTMCGENTRLHDKVHLVSNYEDNGAYRNLSFTDLKDYILKFRKVTGRQIGCVVIDHIGALKKKGKDGENQDLMDICHSMKAFAIETGTLLVMQSQAPREKAGAGDIELGKDAAYGTVYFESYCDYLLTIWQPLKRCYGEASCPSVTAYKFCKIRHKKKHKDKIQEDDRHLLYFDPETEHMRALTQVEEKAFDFYNKKATGIRKLDRKTDLVPYKSAPPQPELAKEGTTDDPTNEVQRAVSRAG